MTIRNRGIFVFCLFVALPSALFLGYMGWRDGSIFDVVMSVFGGLVFARVLWENLSERVYELDRARLERERIVRNAIYGRWAKYVPYIPALLLILGFMSPSTNPDDKLTPLMWLALAALTALIHLGVYCYGCYTMGLWKKD